MSVAVSVPRYDPTKALAVTLVISFAMHAAYMGTRSGKVPTFIENKAVEMMIVEVKPPPPPPPEPEKPPEPPKPKPPPKIVTKVPDVKPPPEAPPPPTQEAPKETPTPIIAIGISMENTIAGGGIAAPIGNTLGGAMPKQAPNPVEVQAYKAPKYVPPGGADSDPVAEHEVKIPYPEEAKRAQIEGTVRLRITVDFEGKVVEVKVLSGPGYGLDEAAREAIKRFKFKPAMKGGEAVSTTITYNYTFLLD
jgi:periplasmic protein TonB